MALEVHTHDTADRCLVGHAPRLRTHGYILWYVKKLSQNCKVPFSQHAERDGQACESGVRFV